MSYIFAKAFVVYVSSLGVYVHDLRTGVFYKVVKGFGACISLDARDQGYEYTNLQCQDLGEDDVWSHVFSCTDKDCKNW